MHIISLKIKKKCIYSLSLSPPQTYLFIYWFVNALFQCVLIDNWFIDCYKDMQTRIHIWIYQMHINLVICVPTNTFKSVITYNSYLYVCNSHLTFSKSILIVQVVQPYRGTDIATTWKKYICYSKQILKVAPHSCTAHLPPISQTIQVRWTRPAHYVWWNKDKLIIDF